MTGDTSRAADAAVDTFAPWSGASERALRIRIHRARDIAQARAQRIKHSQARALYGIASQLGSEWVFRRAPEDELSDLLAGLGRLFVVAAMLERLEAANG